MEEKFKVITATVNILALEGVEKRLRQIGAPGLSVSKTKGYGAYKNFYQRDLMTTHARIQLYAPQSQVRAILQAIFEGACTGGADDGVVAVGPVERIYRISDGKAVHAGDL